MRNKYYISIFLLINAMQMIYGQDMTLYESAVHIKSEDTLNYRILWPEGFSENNQYPVVLFLHGSGERGSDNKKQLKHGSQPFLSPEYRKKYPAIVIFPQCNEDDYWSNIEINRSKKGREKYSFVYGEKPNKSLDLVIDLLDKMLKQNYTDNSRIYLGGLSMGGMGCFEMLYRMPNTFAAAFPICGGGDPGSVSAYSDKVSLWIFHGARDTIVDPSFSLDMARAILQSGGFPKLTLYDFADHNSWDPAFNEPELMSWLFSNQK